MSEAVLEHARELLRQSRAELEPLCPELGFGSFDDLLAELKDFSADELLALSRAELVELITSGARRATPSR